FVLIDELGAGTEPVAGAAIGEAILSKLDQAGVYGVMTTHYTRLKLYASSPACGAINGAMAFDSKNISPLFQLEVGLPGQSFAFELARKMGLPEGLIQDAERLSGEDFVEMERNLRKIERSRRALDEKLQHVRSTDKVLESITDRYRGELEEIKQTRQDILEKARKEAEEMVKGANRQIENTIRTIRESQADKQQTQQARGALADFMAGLAGKKEADQKAKDDYIERKIANLDARKQRAQARRARKAGEHQAAQDAEQALKQQQEQAFRTAPLQVGEKVRVKRHAMVGEVIEVGKGSVTVAIGSISSRLRPAEVERITAGEFKSQTKANAGKSFIRVDESISRRKLNFSPELDVRGERLNDALEKVMQYIDDAIMLSVGNVRIIHGKGTGVLHEEIQKLLRATPGVESVKDEHIEMGGSGVTVVKLL
ncbi:MAG: Smr/MutS family protein, partial [Bacteroidales bacterium]|nr:Smr/MutS family protein [Bacteroidales bacterium]